MVNQPHSRQRFRVTISAQMERPRLICLPAEQFKKSTGIWNLTQLLNSFQVPWNVPDRALQTVPPEVEVVPSRIPGAGLGVVSRIFIPRHTWLAEYEGTIITGDEKASVYAWQVCVSRVALQLISMVTSWEPASCCINCHCLCFQTGLGKNETRTIDGGNPEMSNWTRFLNNPANVFEENVRAQQCHGKYVTGNVT